VCQGAGKKMLDAGTPLHRAVSGLHEKRVRKSNKLRHPLLSLTSNTLLQVIFVTQPRKPITLTLMKQNLF
jgi:hypothetical protein